MKNNYASIDKALNIDSDIVEVDKKSSEIEVAPEKSQELERRYEAELQRALTEDSQSTSVNIVPRSFYVG